MDWNEYTSKKALGRAKMAAPTQVLIMFAEVYSNKRREGSVEDTWTLEAPILSEMNVDEE